MVGTSIARIPALTFYHVLAQGLSEGEARVAVQAWNQEAERAYQATVGHVRQPLV